MTSKKSGTGADVGFVKRDADGKVQDAGGDFIPETREPGRAAYAIFYFMLILSGLGLWKLVDLIPFL